MADWGPSDLAQSMSGDAHPCGIPLTHDRLNECHYWWHEMARNYHEPREFRWSLGAFLQAARSVTFMLQSEKSGFEDFSWYDTWVQKTRTSDAFQWVNDARVHLVHVGTLAPTSWVELRCLFTKDDWRRTAAKEEGPSAFHANPFVCTHQLMHAADSFIGEEDHGHDVVRQWEVDALPGREVLDLCAEIFGELDRLVSVAHAHTHQRMQMMKGNIPLDRPAGRYPCMERTDQYRIAHFEPRDGSQVWENEPPNLHTG